MSFIWVDDVDCPSKILFFSLWVYTFFLKLMSYKIFRWFLSIFRYGLKWGRKILVVFCGSAAMDEMLHVIN